MATAIFIDNRILDLAEDGFELQMDAAEECPWSNPYFEMAVEVPHPTEAVWKIIADGDRVDRWYPDVSESRLSRILVGKHASARQARPDAVHVRMVEWNEGENYTIEFDESWPEAVSHMTFGAVAIDEHRSMATVKICYPRIRGIRGFFETMRRRSELRDTGRAILKKLRRAVIAENVFNAPTWVDDFAQVA